MRDRTKQDAAEARQAKLAEALRQNLKRRKSQTRARKTPVAGETGAQDTVTDNTATGDDKAPPSGQE